ncbi:hypothetical protein [Streptomyces sp. V3I7]|uniref:hypothetical protein n=1 Tax=Streptomyces sp. V3I7 TaxID=3042278 RepID=UPI00278B952E|nr:hypothetical protein [Streptomyces sp. V3I7]MDQ0994696.1 hypothetical protein [Streptomyces sp. V3I7]
MRKDTRAAAEAGHTSQVEVMAAPAWSSTSRIVTEDTRFYERNGFAPRSVTLQTSL